MKVREMVDQFGFKVLAAPDRLDAEVSGGYASDLLSDVMANGRPGNVWITLQTHQNIIAVAKLRSLAAIVLVNDRRPDPETLKSAEDERVPLLSTGEPAFRVCGKLYARLGIKD